jgi:VIT1/CCC1 family predicted Fe2+/Mn2+ transporter
MHKEKHFQQSDTIRDIVIGMSDGLTVPFALSAGLTGMASISNAIIITAGIAEICAGSIAMGLGGYLAGKTEIDHYDSELKREYREIKEFYQEERDEVKRIFAEYGLSDASQELIMDEMVKDPDKWVEFMMRFELGLDKPDVARAKKSAFNIGFSYIVGGSIPLLGYVFTETPFEGLMWSSSITVLCLMIFGYSKSKLMDMNPWSGAIKTTAIGVIAAAAAFFIARLFS